MEATVLQYGGGKTLKHLAKQLLGTVLFFFFLVVLVLLAGIL